MLPAILAGAALGLGKSILVDKPQADAQRKLAATTAELSPWTGMTPTMPQEANPLGSIMQGGLAGAQLYQGMQTQELQNKLLEDKLAKNNPVANPGTFTPPAGAGSSTMNYKPGKSSWMMIS